MDTATTPNRRRLGDIFVEQGLVTHQQLQEALAIQQVDKSKLGEILVALGYTTRIALAGVISQHWDDRRTARLSECEGGSAQPPTPSMGRDSYLGELRAQLAERDERISRQAETIDTLLDRLAGLSEARGADFSL